MLLTEAASWRMTSWQVLSLEGNLNPKEQADQTEQRWENAMPARYQSIVLEKSVTPTSASPSSQSFLGFPGFCVQSFFHLKGNIDVDDYLEDGCQRASSFPPLICKKLHEESVLNLFLKAPAWKFNMAAYATLYKLIRTDSVNRI